MKSDRSGFTLFEATAALFIMTSVVVMISQVNVFAKRQQKVRVQRRLAAQVAANLMEEVAAHRFSELAPGIAGERSLSAGTRRQLPSAKAVVTLSDCSDVVLCKRIEIVVSWSTRQGGRSDDVRLVAWKHLTPEEHP